MTKKKDGRNKPNKRALKDINEKDVLGLAERFWTKSEIAAFLNCHVDTITNRFQEIFLKGRENGKAKLRDLQFKSAKSGNVTMQIWLGKQYLDQTDKTQVSNLSETELERLREIATQEMKQNL
jgi:hypothetical protein